MEIEALEWCERLDQRARLRPDGGIKTGDELARHESGLTGRRVVASLAMQP